MTCVHIIGLGPGEPDYLTVKAWNLLRSGVPLFLKTEKHPVAALLQQERIKFYSFDFPLHLENGEEAVDRICSRVIAAAQEGGRAAYAVPGSLRGEASVKELYRRSRESGLKVQIVPGLGLPEAAAALSLSEEEGFLVVDTAGLQAVEDLYRCHLLVTRVSSPGTACRLKLKLMEVYPGDHPVEVLRPGGGSFPQPEPLSLSRLDELSEVDEQTAVYVPPLGRYTLGQLVDIMRRLRKECPWDRQQDHRSLRPYVLEEAYEVVNAITEGGAAEIKEELGDLLLQVVFHSQIAREAGSFGIPEIITGITSKIIHRHPHVFGETEVKDAAEVARNWQKIKAEEGKGKGDFKADKALPSLLKAGKIQKRAADVGFDWPSVEGAADKVKEEVEEVISAYKEGEKVKIEEEMGDILFSVVNMARFLEVDPEVALSTTVEKFIRRFRYIVRKAEEKGERVDKYSLETLDKWWEEAKNKENREKIPKERRNYIE